MTGAPDAAGRLAQRSILTLTINPALDVSTSTERVIPGHKLRCGPTMLDPGGGGVNVARVVQRLGGQAVAVYAAGGPTGQAYRQLLDREGVVARIVNIGGSTRESFTVDETSSGEQFRFVLQGPSLQESEWRDCLDAVDSLGVGGGLLVASGSLPLGVPDDFYARVARIAKQHGMRCVVDASGPALRAALDEGVYLIKPSLRELSELIGTALGSEQDQVAAAQQLVADGRAEVVALTLGAAGAILVTAEGVLRQANPEVEVKSTVGAGDSFLAAFVLRIAQGRSVEEAFRAAVAAGSATAMTPATELCHRADVERLEARLSR
ncbi:MAG: 1-phosphofructokinase family hexose kinase [Rhodoglobus sp.]